MAGTDTRLRLLGIIEAEAEAKEATDDLERIALGRDNTVLDEHFVAQTEGVIRRKTELGGILSYYYRDAA